MRVTTRKQRIKRKIIKGVGVSLFSLALGTGVFCITGNAWRANTLEEMQATANSDEIIQNQKRLKMGEIAGKEGETSNQDAEGGTDSAEKSSSLKKGAGYNVDQRAKMDYDGVSIPSLSQVYEANKPRNRRKAMSYVVGTISIPSVNIHLNILQGTNNVNMLYGATTMLPHQEMGKGNYVLAGHNMKERNVLFSNLITDDKPQVHKGDKIYLSDGKKRYTYEVTYTETINMHNTKCLNPSKEPVITLFTCTLDHNNSGKTLYRFVVHGKLV